MPKKSAEDAVYAILSETDGIYSFSNGLPKKQGKCRPYRRFYGTFDGRYAQNR